MKTKLTAALILAVGVLALAACGSSSDTTSSSTTAESTSTDTTSTSTASGDVATFCAKAQALQSLGATFNTLGPNDIEGAQAAFQQAADAMHEVDDAAPAEVKADADAVVQAFDAINEKIQGAGSAADIKALGPELAPELQSLQTHTQALKAFGQKNC